MCEHAEFLNLKPNFQAILNFNKMTIKETNTPKMEGSSIRRSFTLPRNPFSCNNRMPNRRQQSNDREYDQKIVSNSSDLNKKLFRRPSIRKFINKIAQQIGSVSRINQNPDNRVLPESLQTWEPNETPGVTGLKNHGNTCFINAVIQCISHTDVLAEYFVLDKYKTDLLRRNKLNSKKFGTKGEVTEQLAIILKALWACEYNSDLSLSFKQVVERYGSQYKGNQQHDAQEFLQWLLDKVHEDLNTASKRRFKTIKVSLFKF